MSAVHRDVVLAALSALTGSTLKHHTDVSHRAIAKELHVANFIPISVHGGGLAAKHSFAVRGLQAFNELEGDARARPCPDLFVNLDEFLHPRYDYDYTHLKDNSTCMRGDEPYKRPCGWNRIAIKVLDKYHDGNVWLGTDGWRKDSVCGEWPVSYHGTSLTGATGITEAHYEPGSGKVYGRGIYSTPDIKEAEAYSKPFQHCGKTYRVLMQNRINPKMRKVCARLNYWLIEIPEGTSADEEKKIVEKSIRPYGILLKEV